MACNKRDPVHTYRYTSNRGLIHLVKLTESMAERGGFVQHNPGDAADGPLPKRIKMRYILGVALSDPSKRLKTYIADLSTTDAALSRYFNGLSMTVDGVEYRITSRHSENGRIRKRTPPGP